MKYFYRIFLLIMLHGAMVQAQSELLATLNHISSELKTVKTSSSEWKQTLQTNAKQPYIVLLETSGADKKGQPLNYVYELNLVDLDPSSVKYEIKKDEMQVKMKTLKKNAFIKLKEGQQKISYTDEVAVYAGEIENAKELVASIQKAIPLAKKAMEETIKIGSTFSNLTDWLKANVNVSTSGSDSFKQSLTFQDGFNNLKAKLSHQRSEKGKLDEEISDFNLADLDGSSVDMGISGEWIYLEIPTKSKLKYIGFTKSGKAQNPEKSVKMYFNNVEKAREGKLVFEKLLPTAAPVSEQLKPAYKSMANGLDLLKKAVRKTEETEQSITADCQTILAFNASGKSEEYRFFWGDIDEASPEIKVSGKSYGLSFNTKDKQKFIEVWKNGEKQSYTNSAEFIADDIETIRYIPALLNQLIPDCRKSLKQLQVKSGQEVDYINTRLKSSKNLDKIASQDLVSPEKCKLNFTKTTTGSKSAGKFRYEMLVSELSTSSTQLEVSGSNVYVTVTTGNKEKTIKSFKDDVPSDFVNEIQIECEDLSSAREIKESMDRIIAACKK